MDKSFEGLLLSVFIHILLLVFLWNAKFPATPVKDTTEITLVEKPEPGRQKRKQMVSETEKKDDYKDLKVDTDFLSQFTKRVKKQLKAHESGPTVNAAPKPSPNLQPTQPSHVAGQDPNAEPPDEGVGLPGGARNQPIRNVAIGQSTLSDMIPGIEEGAFTALNSNASTYYVFFNRVNEQVRYRWISALRNFMSGLSPKDMQNLASMERVTTFEIVLNPEGKIVSTTLQGSSGVHKLDFIDIDAFKQSGPFPNPPKGMVEPDGLIHLLYTFDLSFRPPTFGAG